MARITPLLRALRWSNLNDCLARARGRSAACAGRPVVQSRHRGWRFVGGTFRDHAFHGGQVLLWQPEPNRYRLRASLDLGGGQWRSTNNPYDVASDPATFAASVALLNDVVQDERAVPLWVFFGHVANPEIALVEVEIPGIQLPPADVKRGTWLLVCQGVLHTGPSQMAEVITYDASRKEINRTTIKLQ
jgi:hypothetical protein